MVCFLIKYPSFLLSWWTFPSAILNSSCFSSSCSPFSIADALLRASSSACSCFLRASSDGGKILIFRTSRDSWTVRNRTTYLLLGVFSQPPLLLPSFSVPLVPFVFFLLLPFSRVPPFPFPVPLVDVVLLRATQTTSTWKDNQHYFT